MRTIKSLINDELSSRASRRGIRRDITVEDIYYKHPELEKIDSDMVALRASRILAAFEDKEAPLKAMEVRENELKNLREEYIRKNNIDPDFDEEKAFCKECNDEGFVTSPKGIKVVCRACMKEEIEEAFEIAGLRDYTSYKIKNYDANYYGDKKSRNGHLKGFMKLFEEGTEGNPIRLYSDIGSNGKTFLSVIATKYAILEGKSAYYIKAENFINADENLKDFLKQCDFLVIDDYSAELTRKWQIASGINSVLEARYASDRPVVLVSSASREQLISDSDERIAQKIKRSASV
ncbi:MAG: DnaA/Hda family protein [Saccharofermentans sp.]|nr:DnaA/Hda family protein [Saccharofermentans sp.]